jgi:ketosteroid isomerase-like protein
MEVAQTLVDHCKKGKFMDAINATYSPKIVSVEPQGGPNMPARQEGIAAIKGKTEWWEKNHEMHGCKVEGPWPHGDRFIVRFILDVTPKTGPTSGKRMTLDETALYTVKDGKIVQEEFFYHMG